MSPLPEICHRIPPSGELPIVRKHAAPSTRRRSSRKAAAGARVPGLPKSRRVRTTARMKLLPLVLLVVASVVNSVRAAEMKFAIVPNFFDHAPEGQPLGPCHGGAVLDKAGNIYVTTDTKRGIVVYSADGKF